MALTVEPVSGGTLFANRHRTDTVVHHPLVRTRRETGRKELYVDRTFTIGIEGTRPHEAQPLLEQVFIRAVRKPFTCRLRGRAGSVAMGDDRSVPHDAPDDDTRHRRTIRRITIRGDCPRA